MKKNKVKGLITFLSIVVFCGASFSLIARYKSSQQSLWYTWDPGVCVSYEGNMTSFWSKCDTPATDGPCTYEKTCDSPQNPTFIK